MADPLYVYKRNGHAPTKNGALYSDDLYYLSFSTLFCYSVQNKESNCISYVRFKLPHLTLFRLALELIGMYTPRLAASYCTLFLNTLLRVLIRLCWY